MTEFFLWESLLLRFSVYIDRGLDQGVLARLLVWGFVALMLGWEREDLVLCMDP